MPRPGHLYTAHALAGALWFLAGAVCPVSAGAPTVSSYITPSDKAVGVSESTSLIVQFDQNVVKGPSGNITVYGLFNQDLRVDLDDYFLFADQDGTATGQPGYDPRFDLDGDGRVGLSDFFLFADSFGKEAVAP